MEKSQSNFQSGDKAMNYPTIENPLMCARCGRTFFSGASYWEGMFFCSEGCLNAEKEYWCEIADMDRMENESGNNSESE
jgi:hypothetical protein